MKYKKEKFRNMKLKQYLGGEFKIAKEKNKKVKE